jgi:hypothetical protein
MACPLCRRRKGKRLCPAKGARICAVCCGSKRRVEIDCPEDCGYLTGEHAGAWAGRVTEHERDMRRLAPHVAALSDAAAQTTFLLLSGVAALAAREPDLDDARLETALETLRQTSRTRESGLVYEHRAADPRVQAVVRELDALLRAPLAADSELGDEPRAAPPADAAAALGALVSALASTRAERAGARAFVETAARLAGRFAAPASRQPARSRIVEP